MAYKNFRFNIIFRTLLLAFFIALFIYALSNTSWLITTIVIGLIIIFQLYDFINYADRVNSELSRFLSAIKYRDFSQTFAADGRGKSFNELRDSFNFIITEFKNLSKEKELNHLYLQSVVENTGVGIISFTKNGEVELFNRTAREILGVVFLKNVKSLDRIDTSLPSKLMNTGIGENNLFLIEVKGEKKQLATYTAEIKANEETIKIISFQNIKQELEEREVDAWQKLIRVLTHEIMNSVTPISSLTSTTIQLLEEQEGVPAKSADELSIQDIYSALKTIEKRSKGLLHFVDIYRNLTRIPIPNFKTFELEELFNRINVLLKTELSNKQITLQVENYSSAPLRADIELIEQVLINLLLNAIDALHNKPAPLIKIIGITEKERTVIKVADNGEGIPEELIDKIFVPFFTTKENGSGIGLSLSRQILRLHSGTIDVNSDENGTIFILKI